MGNLFQTIVDMSITASVCVVIICIIRLFLKKAPKVYSYLLWSVVAFRLVCPFSLESDISLFNLSKLSDSIFFAEIEQAERWNNATEDELADSNQFLTEDLQITADLTISGEIVNDNITFSLDGNDIQATQSAQDEKSEYRNSIDSGNIVHLLRDIVFVTLPYIWIGGLIILLIFSIIQFQRLRIRLEKSAVPGLSCYIRSKVIPVWESNILSTPFIMGIFKLKIFLPAHLDLDERNYVIAHESAHIRRKDHMIKQFAYLLTCIHWFNPLIWLSYFLMTKDMEMSCDEAVLGQGELGIRKNYSNTLLNLASEQYHFGGSPLAFGENNIKARIKNIMNYKKPAFWVSLICFLCVGILAAVMITNPKSEENSNAKNAIPLTEDELIYYTDYLNLPENNGFILTSFNSPKDIYWDIVLYDGANLQNSVCSENEKQIYFEYIEEEYDSELFEILHHFTTEQIDNFAKEKTGLSYNQMNYKLDWLYLAEYDTYHSVLKGDTLYTEVECIGGYKDIENNFLVLEYESTQQDLLYGSVTFQMDSDHPELLYFQKNVLIKEFIHYEPKLYEENNLHEDANVNDSKMNIKVNLEDIPELIPDIFWGMSLQEILDALNVDEADCHERVDMKSSLYDVYEIYEQTWNGYPVTLRLIYCPIKCTDGQDLGLVSMAVIIRDITVSIESAETILTEQYQELYPEGESIFPSAITGHELSWYSNLSEEITEELTLIGKQAEANGGLSASITAEEWAKNHSRCYMTLSIASEEQENNESCTSIYASAFSAATLRHLHNDTSEYYLMGQVNVESLQVYKLPQMSSNVVAELEQDDIVRITAIGSSVYIKGIEAGEFTNSDFSVEECADYATILYKTISSGWQQGYVKAETLNINIFQNTTDTFAYWIGKTWSEAFCARIGSSLYDMADDKDAFLEWEMAQYMERDGDDVYGSFGYSSPWPWGNYQIFLSSEDSIHRSLQTIDDTDVVIYYSVESSDASLDEVWRQDLSINDEKLSGINKIKDLLYGSVKSYTEL